MYSQFVGVKTGCISEVNFTKMNCDPAFDNYPILYPTHCKQNGAKVSISIQGNGGPMVLHKCLALATCIRSKSN